MTGSPCRVRASFQRAFRSTICWLIAFGALVLSTASAQTIGITASGTTSATAYSLSDTAYTQTFDGLPSSGTVTWTNATTISGWYTALSTGTANATIAIADGSANLADLRIASLGTSGSTERALAVHTQLATTSTYIGVAFTNNSGRELTSFNLAYAAEQWRENTNVRTLTFTVQYRVGATSADLNSTTGWTTISGLTHTTLNGAVGSASKSATNVAVSVPAGSTIWFRWVTSNDATGTATSSQDIVAVDNVSISFAAAADGSPVITSQPASQTVTVGAAATFSVTATGDAPLTYQWTKNGDPIANATNSTYTIAATTSNDAGTYRVVVTNAKSSITSAAATLTVNVPTPPSITTQPSSQTVTVGDAVTLSVVATGSAPLSYQWKKGGQNISNATAASYTIASAQLSDAGAYTVQVSNSLDTVLSAEATLTVQNPAPVAPSITTQPNDRTVALGGSATFSVVATGSAPLSYQWQKNGTDINGATASSYTISLVQNGDLGTYRVRVTNSVSSVLSNNATLSLATAIPLTSFNLTGFATVGSGTTGGGVIAETDAAYRKVSTPQQFVQAIIDSNKTAGAVKVIEIMNDLNLGWIEVGATVQNLLSNALRAHATAKLHPVLKVTGVSVIDIKAKSPLTIFSANGSTIRHCNFNVKGTSNIIIRNLKFDEMWEWDEGTKGDYDTNDWDFITLGNGGDVNNIWIDHCTFTKAYDGIIDMKVGTTNVTVSWCRIIGDDGATNPNSWVRQQLAALEANKASYTGYKFLRDTVGYTVDEIATMIQGHDKGSLMGATSLNSGNSTLATTYHHMWFRNVWDRVVPRLRGGNVHNYNIYVDDVGGLAARRLRDTKANLLSSTVLTSFNNGSPYKLRPFLNGTISTEGGAILVEKSYYSDCITPLRNNQTDPSDARYTGKIKAVDTIYRFNNADNSVTLVRGDSTDANNPLGPFQATIIPFSWNFPNNTLPYSVPSMDDPANLPDILASGSGAGTLTWSKDNWLRIAYVEDTTIPPSIVVQPQSVTNALGADTTFVVQATGSATLTYQWKKGTTNLTDGGRISGATSAVLTLSDTAYADAGNYTVTVTNANGTVTSSAATLTVVAPTAPSISVHPVSQTVREGFGVQFSVVATGSAPFSYQWKKGGVDISGATGPNFDIEFTQQTDAGDYSVVVSNLGGTATSSAATLTIASATAIPVAGAASDVANNSFTANWAAVDGATSYQLDVATNNSFSAFVPGYENLDVGANLNRGVVGLASGTSYFYRVRAVGAGGTSNNSSVISVTTSGAAASVVDLSALTWYQTRTSDSIAVNTTAKTVTFTEGQTSASGFITHLASPINVAIGQTLTMTINFETGANAKSITNALRFGLFDSKNTRFSASANTETNTVFYDDTGYMASYNFDTGNGTLYSRIPGSTNGTLMGSTAIGLYLSAGAQLVSGAPAAISSSTAYSLTITLVRKDGSVDFTARLNGGSTVNFVLTGTDTTTDSRNTSSFDEFAVRIAGGTTSIDTLKLNSLQFSVEATPQPNQAPTITTQPQSQSTTVGSAVTFSVAASGTTPFTYQWRKNQQPIANATNSSYTIASATANDAGSYDVVVTNSIGSTPSNAATLTVNQPISAPTASAATSVGNTGFTANWSAVSAAVSYRLDVSTSSTFATFVTGYQDLNVGNVTTYAVTGLTTGTTHYYRVRAVGSVVTSANSNSITATTTGPVTTTVDVSALTWYQTRTADSVAVNTTAKTVTFTEGQTSASSFITHLASPINVPIGQTLTMTINFETGANAKSITNALRFGLFDSKNTRITASANTETNAVFYDDTGYMASYNFDTGNGTLYSRIPGTTNGSIMGSTAVGLYLSAGAQLVSGAPAPISSSTAYSLTITLVRKDGSVDFTARLNGGSTVNYVQTGTDTTTDSRSTSSFDEVAVRIAGGTGSIDTLKLTGLQFALETTQVVQPTGFEAWQIQNFTAEERTNSAISGPSASAAGDGVSNFVKYALGLGPKALMPANWQQTELLAGGWVFVYQRPSARSDITYSVEVTNDLVNWTTTGVVHELESTANGTDTWRAIYVPPQDKPNAFFRLKVVK